MDGNGASAVAVAAEAVAVAVAGQGRVGGVTVTKLYNAIWLDLDDLKF